MEWMYEKKHAHLSIFKSYRSPFPHHATELDVAMYEIASRYRIEELKTYSNLRIHQMLETAFDRGLGEEELVRMMWPVYDIHLPPTDGLVDYRFRRSNESRENFTNDQKARIRELQNDIPAFGSDRRWTTL